MKGKGIEICQSSSPPTTEHPRHCWGSHHGNLDLSGIANRKFKALFAPPRPPPHAPPPAPPPPGRWRVTRRGAPPAKGDSTARIVALLSEASWLADRLDDARQGAARALSLTR